MEAAGGHWCGRQLTSARVLWNWGVSRRKLLQEQRRQRQRWLGLRASLGQVSPSGTRPCLHLALRLTTSVCDAGASDLIVYSFAVYVSNDAGCESASPVTILFQPVVLPSLPENFVAKVSAPFQILLTWARPSDTGRVG